MAGFSEQLHGGPVNDEEIVRVREAILFEDPDRPRKLTRFFILLLLAAAIATFGLLADSGCYCHRGDDRRSADAADHGRRLRRRPRRSQDHPQFANHIDSRYHHCNCRRILAYLVHAFRALCGSEHPDHGAHDPTS